MDIPKVSPSFIQRVREPVRATGIEVIQINVGYRCNLECRHCHVKAGPDRTEVMSVGVMEQCLKVLKAHSIPTIDITGGSPELHPQFSWFLQECAALRRRVLVRSNGVILLEKEHEYLLDLYVAGKIEVVLSMPHLDSRVTDQQRGEGGFARLIEVMRRLNARGYGQDGSGLILDLAHNPAGAYLPGSQASLQSQYQKRLKERYGVSFNRLFCLNNMPIGRYMHYLLEKDNYEDYMRTLVNGFNPDSLGRVMCKSTVSVGWDGRLYDCDFNQVLDMSINSGAPCHICAFDMRSLASRQIVVGDHCYGCTAGPGSSCQGQTA